MTRNGTDQRRITDLSTPTPEAIKYRNTQFLRDPEHPYETGLDDDPERLRRKIWNVRNGDLRRLFRQFPVQEPLPRQCAHWVHAVVGKHFFPDANHRTAIATLRRLMRHNDIYPPAWPVDRLRTARKESHTIRGEVDPIRLDTLYRRDRLHDRWYEFFTAVDLTTD
ncbi:hypothetical protein [Halobellus sp. H-GB7]|uniref:hypothetical protein n=1 Tax=Halobellus sp. H-GB7 TaxID=3069756 RepID=UPI0027B7E9D3|nr:hypothetical protein [Halobellus sp. H-GB7]MDQ2053230.1 hypothetical protein [Halobellus sp. H-GB7]